MVSSLSSVTVLDAVGALVVPDMLDGVGTEVFFADRTEVFADREELALTGALRNARGVPGATERDAT